jgi:CubicO group peptidase (beta-lactamase class C family)
MAAENVSSELDRLVERWAPRPAAPASPARADEDAVALLDALNAAITRTFDPAVDPEGTKLALALAIVEDGQRMSTGSRDQIAHSLDELEDLLDGLFVAIEALKSAPGGAARG